MVNLLKLKPHALDENRSNHKLTPLNPGELDIIRPLGKGSYGTVFEARWLGTRCALKIFAASEEKSYENEVEILQKLSHPNIVQILHSVEPHGFLMELMSTDLRTYMDQILGSEDQTQMSRMSSDKDQGPFTVAEALDIMSKIAEAMDYIHKSGVVHRDLKAKNVLITVPSPSPERYVGVKVADFGVSEYIGTSEQTINVGTRRYMAPEVFGLDDLELGFPTVKNPFKTDVYSFAITASEILTGQDPFRDNKTLRDIQRRIMKGLRPTLPTSLPPKLVSLIEKCWDGEPNRRPDFSDICMELTSLKSIHTITGRELNIRPLELSSASANSLEGLITLDSVGQGEIGKESEMTTNSTVDTEIISPGKSISSAPVLCQPAIPEKFKEGGNISIQTWLNSMEHYFDVGNQPPNKKVDLAITYLEPNVGQKWRNIAQNLRSEGNDPKDWDVFCRTLIELYGSPPLQDNSKEDQRKPSCKCVLM